MWIGNIFLKEGFGINNSAGLELVFGVVEDCRSLSLGLFKLGLFRQISASLSDLAQHGLAVTLFCSVFVVEGID